MRATVASASLIALLMSSSTHAAPWCASYTFGGGMNCGFFNFEQCRSTVAGVGGSCIRNPAEPNEAAPARNRATREEPRKVKQAAPRPEPPAKPVVAVPPPAATPAPAPPVRPVAATLPPAMPVVSAPAQTGAQSAGGFSAARQLVLNGKYEAGLAALKSLDFDEHPDIAAYTGFAHSKLGRPVEAKVWYEKALASNPDHLPALSYYGMLLVEQGDLPKAQEDLEKIRKICGNTGCYEYAALQAVIATRRK